MSVDAGIVDWLKTAALFAASTDGAFAALWGAEAVETEIISTLALDADAIAEAARQQGFLEGPLAVDIHDVPGLREDLIGRPVTITADQLGYGAGVVVFVIGAKEHERVERTTLIVLRRLP